MSVRAKVVCASKSLCAHHRSDGTTVEAANLTFYGVHKALHDATGKQIPGNGHVENEIFGEYTPSINFSMYVVNPEAHKQFKQGEMYYLDFTPVPADPEAK